MKRFKVVNNVGDHLPQLEWNNILAVATSIQQVQFRSDLDAYCFISPENIYEYLVSIFVRRNFSHLHEHNKFIHQASDSSLFIKWLNKYESNSSSKTQLQFQYQQVNMNTFAFLGSLCICMWTGAFLHLIAERFIYKQVRRGNSACVWIFIEMAIDPYRYFFLNDLYYY